MPWPWPWHWPTSRSKSLPGGGPQFSEFACWISNIYGEIILFIYWRWEKWCFHYTESTIELLDVAIVSQTILCSCSHFRWDNITKIIWCQFIFNFIHLTKFLFSRQDLSISHPISAYKEAIEQNLGSRVTILAASYCKQSSLVESVSVILSQTIHAYYKWGLIKMGQSISRHLCPSKLNTFYYFS